MTRETKIGLLVGLAFIIVIGILLSDHLTSSTEPPPVNYTDAGKEVRKTYQAPGGTQNNAPVVVAPQVQPHQQVPTPRDILKPTAPAEVVKIAIGGGSLQQQTSPQVTQTPVSAQPEPPIKFVDPQPVRANMIAQEKPTAGADGPGGALAKIAQNAGEPLVTAYPGGEQKPVQVATTPSDSNSREYVAQPGENLSKIAAKVFGTSTKAGQDAIVALNPSLQQDRNKIIAGKTYRVPTNGAVASAAPQVALTAPAQKAPQPASTNEVWYTVKDGDTLTRIASEELGDANAVEAIKALNRDTLPDPNILKVNQKIRLPAKPMAAAN